MRGDLKEPTSAIQMHGLVLVRKLDQLLDCFSLSLKNLLTIPFASPKPSGISGMGSSQRKKN